MAENPISDQVETVDQSTFDRLVQTRKDQIWDKLQQGTWHAARLHGGEWLLSGATRLQRVVYTSSLAGFACILLAILGVTAMALQPDSILGLLCAALCAATAVGVVWARNKWLAPVLGDVGQASTALGFLEAIRSANAEIEDAVKRGQAQATELAAAVDAMWPGIEELVVEFHRLDDAVERCQWQPYIRADYRTALEERRAEVADLLATVTAELEAAARILFAGRDDLLVAVAALDASPRLPVTVLTEDAQQALAEARELLAAIAAHAGS